MGFDRTNTANLLALKTEEATDPIAMGYAAVRGQTKGTLNFFNRGGKNVGNETTPRKLTTRRFLNTLVVNDLNAAGVSNGEKRFLESFLNRDLDEVIEPWRAKIIASFATGSATEAAIATDVRKQSRAEVLFGLGTEITREDWITARDS